MDNHSPQRQPSKHQTEKHAGATCITGHHVVHQPHGLNSHHPQIATEHQDAAQSKGTEQWRAGANRATARSVLEAKAQLYPNASGKPHTLQRFCPLTAGRHTCQ
jgi:hypothetical protein